MRRYKPKIIGIYGIRNLTNGKIYVGSAVNMNNRWSTHESTLENNYHGNLKLQRAWNKYGAGSFKFEVLELCKKSELLIREQYWIDKLDSARSGYNISANATSALGRKWKPKSKLKASVSALRVAADPEERKRRSERAKRQHAEGIFGHQTWTKKSEKSFKRKMKNKDRTFAVQALKDHWKKPESRKEQSIKLHAYCSSHPEAMARRSKIYWDSLSKEDRIALGIKISKGRRQPDRPRSKYRPETAF